MLENLCGTLGCVRSYDLMQFLHSSPTRLTALSHRVFDTLTVLLASFALTGQQQRLN